MTNATVIPTFKVLAVMNVVVHSNCHGMAILLMDNHTSMLNVLTRGIVIEKLGCATALRDSLVRHVTGCVVQMIVVVKDNV